MRGDGMNKEILERLREITPEEQAILDGRTDIDRDIYMQGRSNTVNAKKLLSAGKLITLRPHTRFIHFPEHVHDYVEVVYMCAGQTTHIVNGQAITLEQGDLLFLGQRATHEIQRAGDRDVAVNFIVLPDFFATTLTAIGEEETPLRRFLVDILCGADGGAGYLHFRVAGVQEVQNLAENLILTLLGDSGSKRKISQMTMSLLFLELTNHAEALSYPENEDAVAVKILRYIDREYASGSLAEAAALLHYDIPWLSREIKRRTGKTYTQLIQEKRLAQAAFLLKNTRRSVDEIALAVGYENTSFFHRLFHKTYGVSPKGFRDGQ